MDDIYVKRDGLTSHYGIWVDPNIPITGVLANNSACQFISDEMYNGINLTWEEYKESEDFNQDDDDFMYSFNDDTYLIGDWIKDKEGLYTHDPNGEYAAIVRESVTQVVFSIHFKKCALCSPCYPGQADLDSSGDYMAYDLPAEAYKY